MKSTSFDAAALWVASCLALAACELPPTDSPDDTASEPAPTTTTEVTVTQTEPEALPEPEPEPEPSEPSPAPQPPRDGVHETGEQTRGRLAPAKIDAVLKGHNAQFNQCYAKALAASPGLAGTVHLVIVISSEGTVPHAEVDSRSTLQSAEVHGCLIDAAKTLQFDKPVGGRVVTQYPLEFKPAP